MASRGRARVVQQTWELVNALWGQEGHIEARRPLPLHGQSTHCFLAQGRSPACGSRRVSSLAEAVHGETQVIGFSDLSSGPFAGALRKLNELLNNHWSATRGSGDGPNWTDLERRKQAVGVWLKNAIGARPLASGG